MGAFDVPAALTYVRSKTSSKKKGPDSKEKKNSLSFSLKNGLRFRFDSNDMCKLFLSTLSVYAKTRANFPIESGPALLYRPFYGHGHVLGGDERAPVPPGGLGGADGGHGAGGEGQGHPESSPHPRAGVQGGRRKSADVYREVQLETPEIEVRIERSVYS